MLRHLTLLGPQYPDLLAPPEHTPGAQSGLIHPRYLFHTRSPTAKITRGIRSQTLPFFGHAYLKNTEYMHKHPDRYNNPPGKNTIFSFPTSKPPTKKSYRYCRILISTPPKRPPAHARDKFD